MGGRTVSRIRSVHPGLFTDEAFVSLSPLARIFLIGLWTECDDCGLFEWSPLKLKMRILPADNADGLSLLAEIEAAGVIMRYEVNGKAYGAVRNFCQFQRPKKPNSPHPKTELVANFINLNAREVRDGSEPVPHQFPTASEKSRQMEDGGWRMEDGEEEPSGSSGQECESKPADAVVAEWNSVADASGLPTVSKLSRVRASKLKQRIAEHGLEETVEAIRRLGRSPFCRGENDRGWRANFDWLLRPETITKVLEGTYDDKRGMARPGIQRPRAEADEPLNNMARAIVELRAERLARGG
jgi:hypothetical protein